MSLAELFFQKQSWKQRHAAWRSQKSQEAKAQRQTSRFLLEPLEGRILLSATPTEVIAPQETVSTQAEITPSAGPVVTIGDVTSVEVDAGGVRDVNFVVTLSQAAATNVTLAYQTIEGTASAGVDFQQAAGTLTILAGQTSGLITVRTLGDVLVEPDEFYLVELTNVQGAQFADGGLRARAIGTIQDNDSTSSKLGLFVDDAQVVEGASGSKDAIFRVKLSQSLVSPLTLNYTTQDGSAVAGSDYTATSGTLTFNPGETLKAVTVPILGDLTIEGSETFSLVVTPTGAIANGAAGAAGVATILDDDAGGGVQAVVSVADLVVSEVDAGGVRDVNFVVTLSQAAATNVTLAYQTIEGTASAGVDFQQAAGTLTILAGQTSGLITVRTLGDVLVEPDEFFYLELTNASGAVLAGGGRNLRAIGTIQDNDSTGNRRALFVDDLQRVETDSGTAQAVFSVRLSQPSDTAITVSYFTQDGSAVAGSDYTATSGTLTFNPGETLKAVTVPILGDLTIEGSETFSLVVTPTGAIANGAAGAAGVATILDDDAGGGVQAVVSVADLVVSEVDAGGVRDVNFVVTLSQAAATNVTLAYQTIEGTATAGVDFQQAAGTLTILAGQTSGLITVRTLGDVLVEPDEFFYLELTNASGAVLAGGGRNLRAIGTIQDNDSTGNRRALFVDDLQRVETDSGTAQAVFSVRLSQPSDTAITVSYFTQDGSAVAGSDYTATSGTLTFNPGETLKAVTVPILGDLTIEGSETFSLVVTPTGAIANGAAGAAGVATILDDDAGGGVQAVVSVADLVVSEVDAGGVRDVNFVVTLSQAAATNVTLAYQTIEGTASAGVDFQQAAGTLTILAGQTSGLITVRTLGDVLVEPDEFFYLELTNASGAVLAGGGRNLRATGAILDNDRGDTRPSLFVEDALVVEGVTGTQRLVTFEVHLSQPVNETVTVAYTTAPGTASSGSDYTPQQGTLTFAPGQTVAAVQIPIIGDNTTEASERFSLILSAPQGTTVAAGGAGVAGTATILDDDAGGGLVPVISLADETVEEVNAGGVRDVNFVVTLSAPSSSAVTVAYQTVTGTATAGVDFQQVAGTLTIAAGQTSGLITVRTLGDALVEPDETFVLQLSTPVNAVLAGGATTLQGTGLILDNDQLTPVPGLSIVTVQDITVQEQVGGSNAIFTLKLPIPAELTITGTYTVLAGTATAGADFTAGSGTFTILAGASSTTISVPILDDLVQEGSERFGLNLKNLTNAEFIDRARTVFLLGTILDNDPANAAPQAANDFYSTDEDTAITIGVSGLLDNDSDPDGSVIAIMAINGLISQINRPIALPSGALLTVNMNGSFVYNPNSQFEQLNNGEIIHDSFTYTIADTNGLFDTATALITIAGVTDQIVISPVPSAGPVVTIGDVTSVEVDAGGVRDVNFVVTLSQAAATNVTLAYQTIEGTASAGVDFQQAAGTLTILAGQTSGLITVRTLGDVLVEPDEFYLVELTNVQGAQFADGGLRARAIGTIQDNDSTSSKLGLFVDDAQVVEGASGSKDAIFRVKLSQSLVSPLTLNYTTQDGSAVAGSDYTATSGTLTFNPGETLKAVTVPILGDLTIEGSETFSLVVTPTGAIANGAAGAAGVATILDDDAGGGVQAVVSVADLVVSEVDAGGVRDVNFVVTLSQAAATNVTLAYQTIEGTASAGVDFQQAAGTLTILAGQTSGLITVRTLGDVLVEPDEFFYLELTNASGAVLAGGGRNLRAIGTIQDNDSTGNRRALFVDDLQRVETDSGTAQAVFSVRLSQPSDTAITVSYFTQDGSAVAGSDYTATSGTLTFNPGETLKAVTVPILGDLTIEGSETFSLVVTPTGAIANGAAGAAGVATILDDDAGGGVQAVVSVADLVVSEVDAGGVRDVNFVVTLSQAAATNVTLAYQTIEGTATAGVDFQQAAGTLTILAGQTSGLITVRTLGDVLVEPDEFFYLELTNASGAVLAGGGRNLRAIGTIQDNDSTGNRRALFVDDLQRVETDSGTAQAVFSVRLSQPSDTAITVSYFTQDGSAVAGSDYTATSGTLTFNPGETLKAVTVPILGDLTIEGSETFSLVVTPTGAIANGAAGAAGVATILDDDAGGGVQAVVSVADLVVSEVDAGGVRDVNFVVTLSQAAATNVTLAYQTIEGTATAGVDFQQAAGTLTILAGQTSGLITVRTLGDVLVEPDEFFYLELTNASGAVLAGGGRNLRATGAILDNDRGDTRPSLFVEDALVVEGVTGTQRLVTFEVHLSQPVNETVTVAYTTAPGTASSGSDYTPQQGTLTFAPGQTVAAVQIPIIGDNTTEASERFSLILSAPQGTTVAAGGAGVAGTATILDDDAGGGLVPVISLADETVEEVNAGGVRDVNFVVTLSAPSSSAVTVAYQTVTGTATAGVDFQQVAGTLTIAAGQTSGLITVRTLGDALVEPDETFVLQLSTPVNAVLAGGATTLQGTGTIRDNDSPAPVPGLPVLTVQDLTVQELVGGSTATFTLTLPAPAGLNVTGTYNILAGTATAGADFIIGSGTFTILAGASSTTITVPVLNDDLVELPETFVLQLTSPQNGQFANASRSLYAIGKIVDNDFVLDVDGNGVADALTDGLLIIRHLFGFTGNALINGVVDPAGARATAPLAEAFLAQISDRLDVDGNGRADALTDGLLIIRYLFGFTGNGLINGVVDPAGARTTAPAIESYLQVYLPVSPTASVTESVAVSASAPVVVLDAQTTTTAVPSSDLSLAYVQQAWVTDFVTNSPVVSTQSEDEELLILLPTGA